MPGGDYLLFKNKDFGRMNFDDQVVISRDVFGIRGTTSWAGTDSEGDQFSGFSIGANKHGLFCADSNVREEPPSGTNYDVLTEIALTEGSDVATAVEALQQALSVESFWCANLMLVDPSTVAVVEIKGSELYCSLEPGLATRTNHHVHFGVTATDDDVVTSADRLDWSYRRLSRSADLLDVLELQRSHDGGQTGICNHSSYETVYSYVLMRTDDGIRLLVTQGHPCGDGLTQDLLLPLGESWSREAAAEVRAAFPSADRPTGIC